MPLCQPQAHEGSCLLSTLPTPTIYSGLPRARDSEAGGHKGARPSRAPSAPHPFPQYKVPSRSLSSHTCLAPLLCSQGPNPAGSSACGPSAPIVDASQPFPRRVSKVAGEQGQCLQHLRCSRPPGVEHEWMGTRGVRPIPPRVLVWQNDRSAHSHITPTATKATGPSPWDPGLVNTALPVTVPGRGAFRSCADSSSGISSGSRCQSSGTSRKPETDVATRGVKNPGFQLCFWGQHAHTDSCAYSLQAQDTRALADREVTRDSHLHLHL